MCKAIIAVCHSQTCEDKGTENIDKDNKKEKTESRSNI